MDEIIEKVGNFGRFQCLIFLSNLSSMGVAVSNIMFMMFGSYNPGWSCANDTLQFDGQVLGRNESLTVINGKPKSDITLGNGECDEWRGCSRVTYSTDSSTIVTEWNLMCDNAWVSSVIIIVQMCGVLFGSFLCGFIGDRFGRRVSLYGFIAFTGVGNLVCAFSSSWQMFAAIYFLIGTGVGGILTGCSTYPLEFVGHRGRALLTSVPRWTIGQIIFFFIIFILKDWRHIHFAIFGMSALICLPGVWVPESPRWLAVHGRVNECKRVVQRMAAFNRREPVNPELLDQKIKDIIDADMNTDNPGYLDLFRTAKLRRYSLKFGTVWIGMALVYYFISFGMQAFSGDFFINLILFTLCDIPGMLCIGPLSNKFGRRLTSVIFLSVSALSSFGFVAASFLPFVDKDKITFAFALVSKVSIVAAWGTVGLRSAELYPTQVRNLQSGYLNGLSRIGGMISPFLIPTDNSLLFVAFAVNGVVLLVAVGLMWSVSESNGRPMADVIEEQRNRKEQQLKVPLNSFPPHKV